MRAIRRRRPLIALLALAAAGCGGGSPSGNHVTVTVSRDFGTARLAPTRSATPSTDETVMRLLQRNFDVRVGANRVQEIDGVSDGREDGRRVGWFYYVNGIGSSEAAAQRKLNAGDRIWWDHHDSDSVPRVPAVVGAFPEPFRSGSGGKKLPVRLVCMGDAGRSCDEVETRLQNAGVKAIARSSLEQSVGKVLRILVGTWPEVRKDIVGRSLEAGPSQSGVYARPDAGGGRIALLDTRGDADRTLGAGSGLVAATAQDGFPPTWLVTGTDEVGVAAAAAALTEDALANHFAIAVEAGRGVALPLEAP